MRRRVHFRRWIRGRGGWKGRVRVMETERKEGGFDLNLNWWLAFGSGVFRARYLRTLLFSSIKISRG